MIDAFAAESNFSLTLTQARLIVRFTCVAARFTLSQSSWSAISQKSSMFNR
ncbi:MAG: hypothetical protein IKK39_08635 [Thermoguttaceae bacterium]|nr:hypothetical protein [Thermoguttaceae bacterium]MBR4104107.1 hypothetical protein [Thermoguttaceae bacterium]